jgi:molecular chaperone GrpE
MTEKQTLEEQVESSVEQNEPTDADLNENIASNGDEEIDGEQEVSAEQVQALVAEKEELNQRLLRLQADFENYKRRTREEKARDRQFRAQDLVENLLPVWDNFARALAAKAEHEESAALKQGLDMVYRQFTEALQQEGVKEIEAVGLPFDPNKHQAVMQVESDDYEPNTVVEVLQAGYELNGRVLRPSMVKVSQ